MHHNILGMSAVRMGFSSSLTIFNAIHLLVSLALFLLLVLLIVLALRIQILGSY